MNKEKSVAEEKFVKEKQRQDRLDVNSLQDTQLIPDSNSAAFPRHLGNRAVQRLLTQRSGNSSFDLDENTADCINNERGAGRPLDMAVQKQVGEAVGRDFSGVRVHTSPQADDLNRQLGARAFTTGRDIFFRGGAYQPHTSSGQELIAHELTHVVQQSEGRVPAGNGRLTVRPPGDEFEQEADAVARAVTGTGGEAQVQRQLDEEEQIQASPLQRQALDEEEENIQMQEVEEEEDLQLQRQELGEEEEELVT